MERDRKKHTSFRMSDCITDIMTVFGFKKSKQNDDEMSKESSSQLDDDSESHHSETTVFTEQKYASMAIDEEEG